MVWLFSLAFSPGRSKAAKDAEQAVLLVLALVVSWAAAGGGPAGAQTLSGNGLQMDVAFVALRHRPGYRPVRISALPTAAVTADRTLSIEILLGRTTDGYDLRVVKELEIPAGSGLQTMTIPVSELAGGDLYRVNVSEDHIPLNALCVPWTTYSSYWSEALPAILFMGSSLPDTSGLAAALPPYAGGAYYGGVQPPVRTSPFASPQLATADNWAMRDFSEQWIDYSGFDIVCLSHEQLAALWQSRPAVLRAGRLDGGRRQPLGLGRGRPVAARAGIGKTPRTPAGPRRGGVQGAAGLDGAGQVVLCPFRPTRFRFPSPAGGTRRGAARRGALSRRGRLAWPVGLHGRGPLALVSAPRALAETG